MDNLVTSNIRQRPIRTLVSVAGVALGVALVMLFTGLARGMSNDLQRRATNVRAELIFMRPGAVQLTATTANLDTRYVDRLRQIDGIEEALPVIRHFNQGTRGIGIEQIDGVDWNSYARVNGINMVAGRGPQIFQQYELVPGADPQNPKEEEKIVGEVVIDEVKAQQSNYHLGDLLQPVGKHRYRLVGIYSPESGARVKLLLEPMQKELEAEGKCTFIFLKLRNPDQLQEVAQRIDRELPGNTIQPTREVFTSFEKSIPLLGVFLRVLVVLAAVVSSLVVMLAMYTTITERTREIGILKAMGASRGYIVGIIEKEAILISVIGLIAGFVVSLVAGFLIHKAYGLVFEYSWRWAAVAAVIGVVGGILGALYPAWKASNLDPVNALAYE